MVPQGAAIGNSLTHTGEFPNRRGSWEAEGGQPRTGSSGQGRVDRSWEESGVTGRILAGAIAVHRELGPGLMESLYRRCLVHELTQAGLEVASEREYSVVYKGVQLGRRFRIDLLVDESVVVELKAVRSIEPVHLAQLRTYLRVAALTVGLLINFNVPVLRSGVRRIELVRRGDR